MDFKRLRGNLRRNFPGLRPVKVAVLGDSATQLLCTAFRGYGREVGLDLEVYEGEYDQMDREVRDPGSGLYQFAPAYTVLFPSTQKLLSKFRKCDLESRQGFAESMLASIQAQWVALQRLRGASIVQFNFAEIEDGAFGHFAGKVGHSFLFQLRKINLGLMELSQRHANVFLTDVAALQARVGRDAAVSAQTYVNADLAFALDFLPELARATVDTIAAALGLGRKCLILDLDNTVWGGVIGDDGMDNIQIGDLGIGKAFTDFQWWVKQLKERGIVVAVCSKNTEHLAKEPFERHPDMVLRLDDIAIFVANWETKPDNIRKIQSVLNIGFDSMVFLDDSPFERAMVRQAIPHLTVPELPEDPAEYVSFLTAANLFATTAFSREDAGRTQMYREEAGRKELEASFTSEAEFLAGLGMQATVSAFDGWSAPRVAQLTQRSNQFNLRTVRYSQGEIEEIARSEQARTLAITLDDRFGSYGLIGAVILRRADDSYFIDTWIMSCRVLKRGVEAFTLNKLVETCRKDGVARLVGEYLATPKNGIVKDHYSGMGFRPVGERWELVASEYQVRETFVEETTNDRRAGTG
jgi:FkbH-like protein